MKFIKILTAIAAVALTGFVLAVAFADTTTNAPASAPQGNGSGSHAGRGPGLDRLLAPKLVTNLKLTADQQTAYNTFETSFKKDAAKWNAENPIDPQAYQTAKETDDQEALRQIRERRQGLADIRRGYIDKFRAMLTSDQKTTLDDALAPFRRNHQQQKSTAPTPPPAE